jgi:hypothetical protein
MGYSKINLFMGNLMCRLFDIQMSRFRTLLLKFVITVIGIFSLLLILLRALDQSINNGELIQYLQLSPDNIDALVLITMAYAGIGDRSQVFEP